MLPPLVAIGVLSVAYWHATDDLRPYALVQFLPLVAIPVLLSAFDPAFTHGAWQMYALGWHAAAKVFEALDVPIFQATGGRVSGHTLKHLAASVVPLCMAYMVVARRPILYSSEQQ